MEKKIISKYIELKKDILLERDEIFYTINLFYDNDGETIREIKIKENFKKRYLERGEEIFEEILNFLKEENII